MVSVILRTSDRTFDITPLTTLEFYENVRLVSFPTKEIVSPKLPATAAPTLETAEETLDPTEPKVAAVVSPTSPSRDDIADPTVP